MERNEKVQWIQTKLNDTKYDIIDDDFLDSLMEDLGYEPEDEDDENDEEAAVE